MDNVNLGNRVLLVGDIHSKPMHIELLSGHVSNMNPSSVIVLGDTLFNDWHNQDKLAMMSSSGVPWYLIDGNHDDICMDESISQTTITKLYDNVYFVPRGYVHIENGKRFVFIGGAHSIDRGGRMPYLDWWPNEAPSLGLLNQISYYGKHDDETIVFAHECPLSWELRNKMSASESVLDPMQVRAGENLREWFGIIAKELDVSRWFHGHHHYRYTGKAFDRPKTVITGLDCTRTASAKGGKWFDNFENSTYILNLN